MNLTTVHSPWLALLCLLLGVGLAWVLYRPGGRDALPRRVAMALAVVRAAVIALVAFLLLEPMVRTMVREVRKPVVVIAHDGSASVGLAGDTTALRTMLAPGLERLQQALADRYQVRTFTYGQEVREGIDTAQSDALTDMGQLFRAVYDRASGPDLGAVIITGDGIRNRGRDPLLEADRLGVPVHVVALGDTTVYPDLLLKEVEHNRLSYLGNEFPLRVRVEARGMRSGRTRVTVSTDGAVVAAREIVLDPGRHVQEVPFRIKADRPGLRRYTVQVEPVPGERTEVNNTMHVHIDVLDDRQQVLIIGAGPHPDIGALHRALDGAGNYAIQAVMAADAPVSVDEVDLLILHGLPSLKHTMVPLLKQAADRNVPALFILSPGMHFDIYNAQGAGVRFTEHRGSMTDAAMAPNKDFQLFTFEPGQLTAMERFPPLQVPFGRADQVRGATAVMYQRIGALRTNDPLVVVQQQGERRVGTIVGEGLWRWRLADMRLNGSHAHFDGFVRKLVQYLALRQDRARFRVEHAPSFEENELVVLRAEVYNAAYELVNDGEVSIELTDEAGGTFAYSFTPVGNAYRLEAGRLPAGRYHWKARTRIDDKPAVIEGDLMVHALMAERFNTVADHHLLADLAARTGGELVRVEEIDRLAQAILNDDRIAARSYGQDRFTDLVDLRWPFFLLLALLTLEWGVRRRQGVY